jgi:hypothetical protein
MNEDDFLRALPLADRCRIAAVDLAVTGAPQALVEAVWEASGEIERGRGAHRRLIPSEPAR